jgi:hypothetical protein
VAQADVVATFEGTAPFQLVTTTATSGSNSATYNGVPVGPFNFTTYDAGGTQLGGNFRAFCADYFQGVSPGDTYNFAPVAISDLPDIGTNATKLARIQTLYDRFFDSTTDAERGGAFQLAMWELAYDGDGALGLGSGNFVATGDSSVALADSWLSSLDDGVPTPQQWTLIGLLSTTNQDQITAVPNVVPAPAGLALIVIGGGLALARRRIIAKKSEGVAKA